MEKSWKLSKKLKILFYFLSFRTNFKRVFMIWLFRILDFVILIDFQIFDEKPYKTFVFGPSKKLKLYATNQFIGLLALRRPENSAKI
jgi:hypothetical protein